MHQAPDLHTHSLRVLIANEHLDRLERVAKVLEDLGHEIVARTVTVADAAEATAAQRPDVAIVGLGDSSEHALGLVSEIVKESYCPVIALLEDYDARWVEEAAQRGVFAYVVEARSGESHSGELQSAIDITLRRFAETRSLKTTVERRHAEAERDRKALTARRRQALELHDSVVQGLVAAQLAHDLGREQESRDALGETLTRAKALVDRSLGELKADGLSTPQLIRDAARNGIDG